MQKVLYVQWQRCWHTWLSGDQARAHSSGSRMAVFFFFLFLTRQRLVTKLREVLQEVGLHPEKYAGHSFCIGVATTARACGVQDSLIKAMGRWESVAYQLYAMCRLLRSSLQQWQLLLLESVRHSLNGTLVFFLHITMCQTCAFWFSVGSYYPSSLHSHGHVLVKLKHELP